MILFTIIWLLLGLIGVILAYNSITKSYYESYNMSQQRHLRRYNYDITLLLKYTIVLVFGGLFSLIFFIMMGYKTFYYNKK